MAGSCQKTKTNEKQSSHNTDNEVMWEDSFTGGRIVWLCLFLLQPILDVYALFSQKGISGIDIFLNR